MPSASTRPSRPRRISRPSRAGAASTAPSGARQPARQVSGQGLHRGLPAGSEGIGKGERGHRGQALHRGRSPEGRAGCPQPLGQGAGLPGGQFAYHLVPFEGAFEARVAAVMPYYAMPLGLTQDGQPVEEVGFGFNRQIITGSVAGPLQV